MTGVLHALAQDVRMMAVALHFETHEVLQVDAAGGLESIECYACGASRVTLTAPPERCQHLARQPASA